MSDKNHHPADAPTPQRELLTFLFLVLALAPILSTALIGGYGLLVWMLE